MVFSVVQVFDTLGGLFDVVEESADACVFCDLCFEDFREYLIDEDSDILKDGTSGFELAHVLDRVCFHALIVSSMRVGASPFQLIPPMSVT